MDKISQVAFGKINLGLNVLKKRFDGYHDLDMIMQTVDISDVITITKTDEKNTIEVSSNTGKIPNDSSNLAYKAAEIICDEFDITDGIKIEIEKNIPIAAGMAGGSADCAATLKAMNKLFDLGLSTGELMDRGVSLGADVPFCVLGGTARAEGIGEVLTPLTPMPYCYILLAKPDVSVSTGFVYGRIDEINVENKPDTEAMISAIENGDLEKLAKNICNVLEEVTIPDYPIIEDIKNEMKNAGALNAMMTGSGPTVFGIFDDEDKAKVAMEKLKLFELEQLYLTKPTTESRM